MKLAILGSGKIVQEALPMLVTLPVEKIALFGREHSREKLEDLQKKYELAEVYYDYDALLHSTYDTLYIALPNSLHYTFTYQALQHGKHVILEKPAVPTVRQFRELRKTAEENNVFLIEAVNIHHLPMYQKIREVLPEIGKIHIVSLNYSQYSSRYDRFLKGDTAPVFDPAFYGGSLMDLNVYNVHFLLGLFGKPESFAYHANIERNIDTSGILQVSYPSFQASLIAAKDCGAAAVSTIQGTKGYIEIDQPVNFMTAFTLHRNNGETMAYTSAPDVYRLTWEFRKIVDMITENRHEEAEKLLDLSEEVLTVLEQARKQAGISFGKVDEE